LAQKKGDLLKGVLISSTISRRTGHWRKKENRQLKKRGEGFQKAGETVGTTLTAGKVLKKGKKTMSMMRGKKKTPNNKREGGECFQYVRGGGRKKWSALNREGQRIRKTIVLIKKTTEKKGPDDGKREILKP